MCSYAPCNGPALFKLQQCDKCLRYTVYCRRFRCVTARQTQKPTCQIH